MKVCLLGLVVLLSACHHKVPQKTTANPLLGAWHLVGVEWVSAERTSALTTVQPGLFVFTEGHYALMWTPSNEPRVPFKVLSKPTDGEALAGFKSIVFNGGSYVYQNGELTTSAQVAKVPGFENGQQNFKVNQQGDQLYLTFYDETYPDGSKPDWSGTWKTVFTLQRPSD